MARVLTHEGPSETLADVLSRAAEVAENRNIDEKGVSESLSRIVAGERIHEDEKRSTEATWSVAKQVCQQEADE